MGLQKWAVYSGSLTPTITPCTSLYLYLSLSISRLQTLTGHTEEVFSCLFNYQGDQIITAGKDNTCRLWR